MDQFQIVCTPFRGCWNKVPVAVAHVARSLIYSHDAIIDSFPSPARTTCSLVHSNLTDRDGFSFLKIINDHKSQLSGLSIVSVQLIGCRYYLQTEV